MTERLTKIKYNGIVSRKHEETGISCSTYCDSCSNGGGNCEYVSEMIKKLAEYETAEEEGRLLVLPCNVGDTVYIIRDDCDFPYDCYQSRTCNRCAYRNLYVDEEVFSLVDIVTNLEVFGITIFLTHEKAEKALEEMKKNE